MKILQIFFLSVFFLSANAVLTLAQNINPDILQKTWKAFWIAVPNEPAHDYGVYHFRKTFQLAQKPTDFIVHVSADNRYKLFVNGKLASLGPARGDVFHWNFETVDIAPYLKAGSNLIAAVVWNEGEEKTEAQISYRTAFILQGNSPAEEIVNTNKSWKGIRDQGYSPLPVNLVNAYYAAGPSEKVDFRQSSINWKTENFNDDTWTNAQQLFNGLPKGVFQYTLGWMLVPRPIPQMELTEQRLSSVRKTEGVKLPAGFPAKKERFTIPANSSVTILLDQSYLTNAYPTILFSKGKDARISLSYAEALYIDEGEESTWKSQNQKGNRNEVGGKRFVGREDSVISNGAENQEFTSLTWRTFRYLQLKVETKDEPLVIDDLYGTFTGYPFEYTAKFNSDESVLTDILKTGWRTARLCAAETYMDCPYYEQLQYVGDTRIQALVSLFNSGDDRLMRNAITLIDNSRMAEGITLSRYPTANAQEIPPFSLWWIGMLHDYWKYRPDIEFVKNKLPGARQVLTFFSRYQQEDGSLKKTPYWNFTDWATTGGWHDGVPPLGKDGNSAVLDLQLLLAYQTAAELESKLGMEEYAKKYTAGAEKLKKTIRSKYWDENKKLIADRSEKDLFSQHANSLAILTGTINGTEAAELAEKILKDKSLTSATIYFQYYVNQALVKAGLGNKYLNWLAIWKANLKQGMTTWAEISDINRTRSDCHAWGAHPNIEFFRTVLGIDSDAPGFSIVKIEPHLGKLKDVSGEIPHPDGKISAQYHVKKGKVEAVIELPAKTPGYLLWKGKRYELKAGEKNTLTL
ncbi:alpha-L-rhamnosidase C-terminal domain-containing protein [Rubrolithibacter danxiaensis]|uniref:alpha-L-rhamnosidase-related protein n=1 Tax=Rubrolithibacter danxiaensis TaxID=3390805 RepID=UPI003BF84016